ICRLSSNFGDFTWLKFSNHNLLSPVLKEQKLFSPDGSAFARRYYTQRVNRILIEGASPSIRMRSRFPLHPSLSAVNGVSIEVLDEVSDEFVIDFVFGLISRGVARRAAPLFARRRAFAADQIAFNRRRAAAGDGGVAPRRRQCAQSRPIFRHAQRTRGPERRQT